MRAPELALAILCCVTLLPRTAPADPPPKGASDQNLEEARLRFQKGVQLFREGSFEAALAEFQKAYQLAPSYRLLYNIAQVEDELHDYVSAMKAFKQYLVDGGGEISAERMNQVSAEIQKLEGRIAHVDVATNVDGAEIRIDDVPAGTTPLRAPIPVNAGPRRIYVSKPGYPATARNVTVAGGERVRIALELAPLAPPPRPVLAAEEPRKPPPRPDAPEGRSHAGAYIGLAVTGVLAAGTGASALLAWNAKKEFDHELAAYPTTKQRIDDDRSRMVKYATVTDALAAATILAGGVTLYLAVSGGSESSKARVGEIRVAPALGGVLVRTDF
jgi:tetratricopeptide (TPR) repeat protein